MFKIRCFRLKYSFFVKFILALYYDLDDIDSTREEYMRYSFCKTISSLSIDEYFIMKNPVKNNLDSYCQ